MTSARAILIWTALTAAVAVPIAAAAASPLLAWRDPVYIAAGFAGIVGLALLLVQPLLIGGYLPGPPAAGRGACIPGSEDAGRWRWCSMSAPFGSLVRRT